MSSAPPVGHSDIKSYYKNKTIFLTGATGFAGKSLIQRILQTCQVANIYILLRPKRGQSFEERRQAYFNEDVFDHFDDREQCMSKIKAVEGDVTLPRLGLSDDVYQTLCKTVNLVFHGAATIQLNGALRKTTMINVYGTQQVIELCRAMVNFDCFIHMSTFAAWPYSDPVLPERVGEFDDLDVTKFMNQMVVATEADETAERAKHLGEYPKYPNTYIFAKTVAEALIKENATDLKVAIIRIPFLGHAFASPFPGWFDTLQTTIALFCVYTTGFVRIGAFLWVKPQGLPVDVISNAMMAISWDMASTHKDEKLKVYNAVPSVDDMPYVEEIQRHVINIVREAPSIRQLLAPPLLTRSYPVFMLYALAKPIFVTGAWVGDTILAASGKKRILMPIANMLLAAGEEFKLILNPKVNKFNKFNCIAETNALDALYSTGEGSLSEVDQDIFAYDIKKNYLNAGDKEAYFRSLYMQYRRKILKEPDSNIPRAVKRFQRIQLFYKVLWYLFYAILFVYLCSYFL